MEDVFPKGITYYAGRSSETSGLKEEWDQKSIERTCWCVCENCNSGWMSDIESRTKPILAPLIRGIFPRKLSTRDQARLAIWVCLHALIVEASAPKTHECYTTHEERMNFAKNNQRLPPDNLIVWIASIPFVGARNTVQSVIIDEACTEAAQVFTCLIGQVAIQFLRWKILAPFRIRNRFLDDRRISGDWKGRAIEIWPNCVIAPNKLPRKLSLRECFDFFTRLKIPSQNTSPGESV